MNVDILAYSQVFYGYSGREVKTTIDAETLPVSELLKEVHIPIQVVKKLGKSAKDAVYEDRFNKFEYAYLAGGDTRSSYLYRVLRHCKDMGMNKEVTVEILEDIMDYHSNNPEDIYKRTGLDKQIDRLYVGDIF